MAAIPSIEGVPVGGDIRAFAADLFGAAADLGYGIVEMDTRSVTLEPLRSGGGRVTVESVFISGGLLRKILRPIEPKEG